MAMYMGAMHFLLLLVGIVLAKEDDHEYQWTILYIVK